MSCLTYKHHSDWFVDCSLSYGCPEILFNRSVGRDGDVTIAGEGLKILFVCSALLDIGPLEWHSGICILYDHMFAFKSGGYHQWDKFFISHFDDITMVYNVILLK